MAEVKMELENRLREVFSPQHLRVEDQSGRHKGHAGATGGGHYDVVLVAAAFAGKTLIEQHRMVNEAVGEMFKGKVHALALKTYSPEQWEQAGA